MSGRRGGSSAGREHSRLPLIPRVPDSTALSNIYTDMGLSGPREPIPSSAREWSATDDAAFRDLQERLREVWPTITMRTLARVNRTGVVVASTSFDFEIPHYLAPVLTA